MIRASALVNARSSRVPGFLGIATTLAIAVAPPAHAADAVRLIVKLKSDGGKSAFTAKARVEKLGADTGTPIRHVRSMAMDAEVVALDGVSPTDTAQALERLRVRPDVEFAEIDRRLELASSSLFSTRDTGRMGGPRRPLPSRVRHDL